MGEALAKETWVLDFMTESYHGSVVVQFGLLVLGACASSIRASCRCLLPRTHHHPSRHSRFRPDTPPDLLVFPAWLLVMLSFYRSAATRHAMKHSQVSGRGRGRGRGEGKAIIFCGCNTMITFSK